MPQMIDPKLGFKTVFGLAFRGGHDTSIINKTIEPLVLGEKRLCKASD